MTSRQRRAPSPKPAPQPEDLPQDFDPNVNYVRAKEPDGTFKANDPETPENEAWVPANPPKPIKSRPVTRGTAKPKAGAPQRAPKTVTTPGFGTTKVYSISPTNNGD